MPMKQPRPFLIALALLLALPGMARSSGAAAPWVGEDHSGRPCNGRNPGNFGPFDYRYDKEKLPVVERRHFTRRIEQLQERENTQHPIREVRYTLTRFPNHHRALNTAVLFSLRKGDTAEGRGHPAECFLQRAINFRPEDPVPHMLYGLYLHRLGRPEAALEFYRRAEQLTPTDANLLYNMGLVHFDSENYEESRHYAEEAYSRGIELPGLRRKLQEAGHWE